jgi:protein SCO1
MAPLSRRTWFASIGVLPSAGAVLRLRDTGRSQIDRAPLTGRERIQRFHLPNVTLMAHTGRRVRFYDDLVKDKKVILNFMYAKCDGVCVPVTSNLLRVQKLLGNRVGRDIFIYSITLKPQEDSWNGLQTYATQRGVGPGWLFLTGAPPDIAVLRRALGFAYADPAEDADLSNHIGMLRFGVEPLARWAAVPGLANPEHIVRTILWDFE